MNHLVNPMPQLWSGDLTHLYESWHSAQERLTSTSPAGLKEFTDRLVRSLSIETGILERIYDLDVGTTQILVMKGFVEDLVSRSSTSIEPSLLIDILRDQESAIRLVMDCVAKSRDLSPGFINELHANLTRNQATTRALDQFGSYADIPLRRGAYKKEPNNPVRPDGEIHEYCPPVHVLSEMESLLTYFDQYRNRDPILVAAWFHHRFTQIHPYQNGNGRVGRALVSLVLLKANLLPVVIDRDLRVKYINALEKADHGNLESLVKLFATLEKRAILQALSIDVDANVTGDMSITKSVIDSFSRKWKKLKVAKDEKFRRVNVIALSLRDKSVGIIQEAFDAVEEAAEHVKLTHKYVAGGGTDQGNHHWYKFEIIETTKNTGKWVNFNEDHYFVKSSIRINDVRLVYVISFHHIGRELSGIAEATSFASIEFYEDDNEKSAKQEKHFECSLELFVITWNTKEADVYAFFQEWLDGSLAVALNKWSDSV